MHPDPDGARTALTFNRKRYFNNADETLAEHRVTAGAGDALVRWTKFDYDGRKGQ